MPIPTQPTIRAPPVYAAGRYERQPAIEKRFEQIKNVLEVAPLLLKNEGRIEALFFIYFIALLVQALIERELRRAMRQRGIHELPPTPRSAPPACLSDVQRLDMRCTG